LLDEFFTAYRKMATGYAAALQTFRSSGGQDQAAADQMVKGQDRAPTELIDKIVDHLHQHMAATRTALQARLAREQKILGAAMVVILGLCAMLGLWLVRSMTRPLRQMAVVARQMADGDLTQEVVYQSRDEIGTLASALNTMATNLRQLLTSVQENTVALSTASHTLATASSQLASHTDSMSQTTTTTAATAQDMRANMTEVAASTEQTTNNVQIIATAAEEMTATVQEIAHNAENARQVTADAVHSVASASTRVDELGSAAQEISKVIDVIMEIAEQTKLLALNATIEAARAGEAGKGFAVVASEVKALAKQTNDATEDIRHKVEAMQRSTTNTVQEITQIEQVITNVNDLVASIATAVEEQSITTRDIANNTGQAATGLQNMGSCVTHATAVSQVIAEEMTQVNTASMELAATSVQLKEQAVSLADMGRNLQGMIGRFRL
jgi:methyl-accepting chemotaxis protein